MRISMIVAVAEDNAIGKNNEMPWYMPRDLKYFKSVTIGHTVLMGSNTFYSLPNGALGQRRNMVLSRSIESLPRVEIYQQAEKAIEVARKDQETEFFIIGGAKIFESLLHLADRIYLTRIHHTFTDADAHFPVLEMSSWREISSIFYPKDEKNPYDATDYIYDRY